jgi:hypothetical protein
LSALVVAKWTALLLSISHQYLINISSISHQYLVNISSMFSSMFLSALSALSSTFSSMFSSMFPSMSGRVVGPFRPFRRLGWSKIYIIIYMRDACSLAEIPNPILVSSYRPRTTLEWRDFPLKRRDFPRNCSLFHFLFNYFFVVAERKRALRWREM